MRFLFVDRLTSMTSEQVTGLRRFPLGEPLRYAAKDGVSEVAPGAVSEAVGQLVSWLCLARNDFTGRPVFLFADAIEVLGKVNAGDTVSMSATIETFDEETVVFSGEANVEGRPVLRIGSCSGYFMPLGEMEDPTVTRARFAALNGDGLVLEGAEGDAFPFHTLIDRVTLLTPGVEVRAEKNFASDLPFYRDHFPRFPVTPIVMLNEMIGEAATKLFSTSSSQSVVIRKIKDIKIKSFVKPGETCEIRLKPHGLEKGVTVAELLKDGKRILRGVYEFEIRETSV